ncbi:MAG TPA: hypothetical protein VGJ66_14240 [Pyrinomonadaceae bacterium]
MKVLHTIAIFDLLQTLTVFNRLAIILLVLITFTPVAFAQETPQPVSVSFDFRNGALGWQAGFARYPPETDKNGFYELLAEIRSLPPELGNGTGFYIQGNNHSDALVMFMKRGLSADNGIVAGQAYQVNFTIVFGSSAPTGCSGVGGSPGDSVNLRAGASPAEPLALLGIPRPFRDLETNVDIGLGSGPTRDGLAASFAGTIANGQPCDSGPRPWVSIQRSHQHTTLVNANSKGEIWFFVGTDSGFEGPTQLYYQRIDVTLTPVSPPPPPVLLTDQTTGRAAALDSVTLMREPFSVISSQNFFSPDHHTRVTLFGYNLELKNGENLSAITAQAEDSQHRVFVLPVEAAQEVADFGWIKQVTLRLPDEIQGTGDVAVSISLRGIASNKVLFSIK